MFDRFTENAKRIMNLARQEAQRLNHEYLGTEHCLLALASLEGCTASRVLSDLGVVRERIRSEVEKLVEQGTTTPMGQLPFTHGAKKALEVGLQEAMDLDDGYFGTEHLLLGLIGENKGIAAKVLMKLRVSAEEVRKRSLAADKSISNSDGVNNSILRRGVQADAVSDLAEGASLTDVINKVNKLLQALRDSGHQGQ